MFVLIGLGNPGADYAGTRHNIGFMVIDAVANAFDGRSFEYGTGEYLIAERRIASVRSLLVKPLTYMNNSGIAVADIMSTYGISPEQMLTVTDDIHLPLGTLRYRLRGRHGGHNGLRSIIDRLGSPDFPRLRCGIGSPEKTDDDLADYVLSPFRAEERNAVETMVRQARDAAIAAATETPDAVARFISRQRI